VNLPRRHGDQKEESHGAFVRGSHPFAKDAKGWATPRIFPASKVVTGTVAIRGRSLAPPEERLRSG